MFSVIMFYVMILSISVLLVVHMLCTVMPLLLCFMFECNDTERQSVAGCQCAEYRHAECLDAERYYVKRRGIECRGATETLILKIRYEQKATPTLLRHHLLKKPI
jgi:hypothetical protein